MIIHIETKAGMSEKALSVLNDLKGFLFEQVEIKDTAFIEKKKELGQILQNSINNPDTLESHDQVWQKIENHTQ